MVRQKDIHRLFMQAMISRRYVTEDLAAVLWKKSEEAVRSLDPEIPTQYDEAEVGTYISEINETLAPFSIEFKSRLDELNGKRVWALVNIIDGEIAQVATEYSAVEIVYFKQLIEMIVLAPGDAYAVSSLAAIREVSNMKPTLTKTQAEAALQSFVANGWLCKTDRGRYRLSSRSLIELESYLRGIYEDEIPECNICTELCTIGVACTVEATDCKAMVHRHCYNIHKRGSNRCPACESDWSTPGAVTRFGEDCVTEGFDDHRKRKRREEEDEDEDEEEIAEPPPDTPPKRGKLIKKSQLTQEQPENDDDDE